MSYRGAGFVAVGRRLATPTIPIPATNSEVRVPNGKRVLQDERLRPPTAFHTKAYLFRTADSASPLALMIGSANLTASALAVGAEMATGGQPIVAGVRAVCALAMDDVLTLLDCRRW